MGVQRENVQWERHGLFPLLKGEVLNFYRTNRVCNHFKSVLHLCMHVGQSLIPVSPDSVNTVQQKSWQKEELLHYVDQHPACP